MLLRIVKVSIARGRESDYWNWARDIVDIWDAGGVARAGGPYLIQAPDGSQTAVWMTVHESEEEAQRLFRALYARDRGAELIALRPPLVEATETEHIPAWSGQGGPPPAPRW